ncbi:Alpha/Beta hydrolase protein [Mycena rebaudengoi]|nr:Alpha/Beta hydrolase protein [Mycena rebaudengoi]
MPTIAVPGQGVQFFYTDTGPPLDAVEYPTLILVHGHTYHSEVFKRMLPLAASRSVRIICINRREYPGSTPYTAVELQVYASGSREERAMLWHREGLTLALGIDKIIEQCELPAAVALIGWSLGNTFILAARVSIASISPESQERLRSSIKWFIMWDPPSQALGIERPPNSYLPLDDTNIRKELRSRAFGKWVAQYFVQEFSAQNRDPAKLNFHYADLTKNPTFENTPQPEILTLIDTTVGDKCDTYLLGPSFANVVSAMTNKALFDPLTGSIWGDSKVCHIYGTQCSGYVIFAAWKVEDWVKSNPSTHIYFRAMDGVNHFLMWDDPERALDEILACTTDL